MGVVNDHPKIQIKMQYGWGYYGLTCATLVGVFIRRTGEVVPSSFVATRMSLRVYRHTSISETSLRILNNLPGQGQPGGTNSVYLG
jgi:hypothetical protein